MPQQSQQALMLNDILLIFCSHKTKLKTLKYLSKGVAIKKRHCKLMLQNIHFVNILLMLQSSIMLCRKFLRSNVCE